MPAATAPVAEPTAISTAARQILRPRSAKPMAVLLELGKVLSRPAPHGRSYESSQRRYHQRQPGSWSR
jgi:hypothetical protein